MTLHFQVSHDIALGVSSPIGSRQPSSRLGSSRGGQLSVPGSAVSGKLPSRDLKSSGGNLLEEDEESFNDYKPTPITKIDTSYNDPLGPAPERPRTSAGNRGAAINDDEFADEEIGDDLLPE